MAKRIGFGNYQYEVVEDWPKVEIRGAVADVCIDARGRIYAGVRNSREDGSVSNILGGIGHVLGCVCKFGSTLYTTKYEPRRFDQHTMGTAETATPTPKTKNRAARP